MRPQRGQLDDEVATDVVRVLDVDELDSDDPQFDLGVSFGDVLFCALSCIVFPS